MIQLVEKVVTLWTNRVDRDKQISLHYIEYMFLFLILGYRRLIGKHRTIENHKGDEEEEETDKKSP